jgi:hypothetical protein
VTTRRKGRANPFFEERQRAPGVAKLGPAIFGPVQRFAVQDLSHYRETFVWPPSFRGDDWWHGFVADIGASGVREPLILLPDLRVIDGGHRLDAARDAGLLEVPGRVAKLSLPLSDEQAFEIEWWAVLAAFGRRQLTPKQCRDLIIDLEAAAEELGFSRGTGAEAWQGTIGLSAKRVAAALGTGKFWATKILVIGRRGSKELREAVKAGRLSVNHAYQQLVERIATAQPPAHTPAWEAALDRFIAESQGLMDVLRGTESTLTAQSAPARRAVAERIETSAGAMRRHINELHTCLDRQA